MSNVPGEYRVEITVRRLDGVAVAPALVLQNAVNRITYDVVCIDEGASFIRTNLTPLDRVVAQPPSEQTDIQAASVGSRAWVKIIGTVAELREVHEGIVFTTCE